MNKKLYGLCVDDGFFFKSISCYKSTLIKGPHPQNKAKQFFINIVIWPRYTALMKKQLVSPKKKFCKSSGILWIIWPHSVSKHSVLTQLEVPSISTAIPACLLLGWSTVAALVSPQLVNSPQLQHTICTTYLWE